MPIFVERDTHLGFPRRPPTRFRVRGFNGMYGFRVYVLGEEGLVITGFGV